MNWIKCSSKLPEYETNVLVYVGVGIKPQDAFIAIDRYVPNRFSERHTAYWFRYGDLVSHWMELPAVPEQI